MNIPPSPPLPDDEARALYLALLKRGGLFRLAEVAASDAGALNHLREAGLVVRQQDELLWTVVDPRTVAARLSAELREAGAGLLARADEPSPVLADLALAYDQAPRPGAARSVIQHLGENAQIQQRIEQLGQACKREILAAQPGGARPAGYLPLGRLTAAAWRERGIELRTIYQPAARADRPTAEYAAHVTALGARIRLLDEEFRRVLVFDREVAVVAGYQDRRVASFIEDPVLVGVVVDQFERDWERAERVRWDAPAVDSGGELVALLKQGLAQRAIATRLGLSERTVAAQISRLRERYDAETLFQLGWQMRAAEG